MLRAEVSIGEADMRVTGKAGRRRDGGDRGLAGRTALPGQQGWGWGWGLNSESTGYSAGG